MTVPVAACGLSRGVSSLYQPAPALRRRGLFEDETMTNLSKQTAMDIALAWREIETAETLLADIEKATANFAPQDIRDAFGRPTRGLELGVPTSESSKRCFNVPFPLARVVIEAHIADKRAILAALTEKARIELAGAQP